MVDEKWNLIAARNLLRSCSLFCWYMTCKASLGRDRTKEVQLSIRLIIAIISFPSTCETCSKESDKQCHNLKTPNTFDISEGNLWHISSSPRKLDSLSTSSFASPSMWYFPVRRRTLAPCNFWALILAVLGKGNMKRAQQAMFWALEKPVTNLCWTNIALKLNSNSRKLLASLKIMLNDFSPVPTTMVSWTP